MERRGYAQKAISNVVKENLSIRAAAAHYNFPNSTLKDRVNIYRKQQAMGCEILFKKSGHPTILNVNCEKDFAARLKYLAARGFGYTPTQVHYAAFSFAEMKRLVIFGIQIEKSQEKTDFQALLREIVIYG